MDKPYGVLTSLLLAVFESCGEARRAYSLWLRLLGPDDRGTTLLRNVRKYLPVDLTEQHNNT